jgi:hypothetical protein
MSDFVFLFRSGAAERQEAMGTPERAKKSMQAWLEWIRELENKGQLSHPGQPLEPAGKLIRGKDKLTTDGPFAEAKDLVLGFIGVRANDLAEAAEIASGCPILAGGGAVEVRPVRLAAM